MGYIMDRIVIPRNGMINNLNEFIGQSDSKQNLEIFSFIYNQQLHHAEPKKEEMFCCYFERTVLLLLFLEEKNLILYAVR